MLQIVLVVLALNGQSETRIGPFESMEKCAQAIYILQEENPEYTYNCEYQPSGD